MSIPDIWDISFDKSLVKEFFSDCFEMDEDSDAYKLATSCGWEDSNDQDAIEHQAEAVESFIRDRNDGIPEEDAMTVSQHIAFYRRAYLPVHIWDETKDSDELDRIAIDKALSVIEGYPGRLDYVVFEMVIDLLKARRA